MPKSVLVINSGSSSLKYQLIDPESRTQLASGLVERIGDRGANISHGSAAGNYRECLDIPDHAAAFNTMLTAFAETGFPLDAGGVSAVGHRVVQGGSRFFEPTVITDQVLAQISDLGVLAPLHTPGQVAGITAARKIFDTVPHVAVFDTAFHQTMSYAASRYALDRDVAEPLRIRKYGFHGTSHEYVSHAAAEFLGTPVTELKQVVLHLGNGASACAVSGGRSVNTSMGFTPLAGLVMGTRTGDIDAGAVLYLAQVAGLSISEIDTLLNKQSGLLGLTGSADMRDLITKVDAGDETARDALELYALRAKEYLGAYAFCMGGLDTVVFTAGVGENSPPARAAICAGLDDYGIVLDSELNNLPNTGTRVISAPDSRVKVLVVPTNEELAIALKTYAALQEG